MMSSVNTTTTTIPIPTIGATTPTITAAQSPPRRREARSPPLTALGDGAQRRRHPSVGGRSGLPMLQFKRGRRRHLDVRAEADHPRSRQPLGRQPASFKCGYICFGDGNKMLGERLVSVSQPMPDVTELPDKGFPWQQQMGGQPEVPRRHRRRHRGGLQDRRPSAAQAVAGLIEAVRDRLNGGQHDGKVAPIVRLEKDCYQHPQYGKTLDAGADDRRLDVAGRSGAGAGAGATSPPPPAEQPRRRRVA